MDLSKNIKQNPRRNFIQSSGALFIASLLLPEFALGCKAAKLQTTDFNQDGRVFKKIRGNVGIYTERGGTIAWSISSKGSIVVDTQFPEQAGHLIETIKQYQTTPIDLLINTHHHGDHTAGNTAFKGLVDRHIAHSNAKINMEKAQQASANGSQVLLPTETFTDQISIKAGGEKLGLYYYGAGHTNGDAIIHFEDANVLHIGDLVFNRRFPYIDTNAGANIESWIKVLDQIINTFGKDAVYIFGHSGESYDVVGNTEDLKAFQNYLEKLYDFGKKSIAAGKTLEELKEVKEIPGAPEWKGDGIMRSLDAVYKEISKE